MAMLRKPRPEPAAAEEMQMGGGQGLAGPGMMAQRRGPSAMGQERGQPVGPGPMPPAPGQPGPFPPAPPVMPMPNAAMPQMKPDVFGGGGSVGPEPGVGLEGLLGGGSPDVRPRPPVGAGPAIGAGATGGAGMNNDVLAQLMQMLQQRGGGRGVGGF